MTWVWVGVRRMTIGTKCPVLPSHPEQTARLYREGKASACRAHDITSERARYFAWGAHSRGTRAYWLGFTREARRWGR